MSKTKMEVKKKFQFIFPVNEKYLEIDRDFVWTGLAQYGQIVNRPENYPNEWYGSYDERVVYDAVNFFGVLLPNFFDFQLYVNDRKLFSNPINFRAIPTIEHALKLPCEYYLPKGTKIFCDTPFVGSYFPTGTAPANTLDDDEAFQSKNITLYLDGYEVEELDRDIVATLPKPYIYVVGGYFVLENLDPQNWGVDLYNTWIPALTGLAWPRVNNEQFKFEQQLLTSDKDNPLAIKYERDCLITKIWRYDWQEFFSETGGSAYIYESLIGDAGLTFPYLPTKAIGNYNQQLGNDIEQDIIRAAPCYHWNMGIGAEQLNHLLQYLRVQKKDMKNFLYQRNINSQEILSALHIPPPYEARDIVPLRKKMSMSDMWNLKLKLDELIEHDGLEIGNWLSSPEGRIEIKETWYMYIKRLILIGVKEFANE